MAYNPPIGSIYHLYTTYSPCLLGGYMLPTTLYRNLKNPLNIPVPWIQKLRWNLKRTSEIAIDPNPPFFVTHPKFNSEWKPLKNDAWNITFLLGWPIFRGELLAFGVVIHPGTGQRKAVAYEQRAIP